MNRPREILLLAIAAMAIVSTGEHAFAQTPKELIGTWTLVSISGDPDGPNPKGMVMFDADGRFIQVTTRADLQKYASSKRSEGTADEFKATALGSLGFFGTYTVTGTTLTRHIEASSFPNLAGADQKLADLTVTSDELKWTNPSAPGAGNLIVVTWKKAK
jgi:hypothetical protein